MSVHGASKPIRVALVDDHQFIADMLRPALERHPDRFEFLGNAARLADVGALLRRRPGRRRPVDYSLPDGRGSDVLRIVAATGRAPGWCCSRPLRVGHPATSDRCRGRRILTKDMGMEPHSSTVIERAHRGDVLLDAGTLRDLMTRPSSGATRLAALAG